jgi:manganese/iron transport system ATP-binding protein
MAFLKELRKSNFTGQFAVHQQDRPILEVSHLTVRYENLPALDDISFSLRNGERVAVVGPNGAGKSTLFKVIAGVLSPSAGEVCVAGQKPGGHICIAYVPQRSQVDWNFPVSVADVVMMGRVGQLGLLRVPKKADWDFVRTCLDEVDMLDLETRQISELSGGQQQRMFIARALAQQAEIMLMDEPLNGLDVRSQEIILNILDRLRGRGVTVLVATHDMQQAAERFDRVMLLNHRLVSFGSPAEVFSAEHLIEAYGGNLRLADSDVQILALDDTCCNTGEEH